MKDNRNLIEEARDEIKRFVKSGQEQPSSRMVAAVNEFIHSIVAIEGRKKNNVAITENEPLRINCNWLRTEIFIIKKEVGYARTKHTI